MVVIGAAVKSVFKYLSRSRAGDADCKWSVHFTTQKPQQGLIFVPGKRRSGGADGLQESHGPTQHVATSSHFHQPSATSSPSSSGLDQSQSSSCSGWRSKSRKMPSASSDEDDGVILSNKQPLTPLVLNPLHLTSTLNVFTPPYEPTVHEEIEPISHLPTPEEKMRQLSEAVGADIVPINITGESFDRQASFRKRLSSADSLSRRSRNLSRQTTLTGTPHVSQKMDSPLIHAGHFSTVGGSVSSCTSNHQQKTREKDLEKRDRAQFENNEQSLAMKIQGPRGQKMSNLHQDHSSYCCSPSLEVQSLSSSGTSSYLTSSCTITPYRTPSVSSSYTQSDVLQGFPSDLMPLLPFGHKAKVIPQTSLKTSLSLSTSPVTSSLCSSPSHTPESEWSYSSDKPLNEAAQCHSSASSSQYLSSSSIADSESQFNYQALHDQTQHSDQLSCDGSSCSTDRWSYQPLSPSSSLHSSQTGGDWNSINQETKCVSGEGWNCDPLLSSGRSSPAFSDCNSLCSEKISSPSLLNQDKKKLSASSYSHTIIRSISLRKSKHPPLPPLRCDSLRRQSGCSKPSCSSSSPRLKRSLCLEQAIHQTLNCTQTFHDPWVPRENTKRDQSELNCGTVTTFEPIYPDCDVAASVASTVSEDLPQSPSHANVIPPASPGSEEETLVFTLNSQPANSSVVGLHRLVSPSSGYSSQSNTPTSGTPLSSPLAPSSPLTASPGACPLTFPVHSSSMPLSPSISMLSTMRSQGEGRPKPPVPERKSSLFSYVSSSLQSSSSVSSCISSEHLAVPPPPPPPPLPPPLLFSPATSVFYSPIFEFPPVPLTYLPPDSSVSKFSGAPTPLSLSLPPESPPPPPPPPSSLTPSTLPTPPPLPPSFHPPPPPYSYTIGQASLHALEPTLSQSSVFPPPPSPPPPSSEIPPLPLTNLPLPLPPPLPPYLPSFPSLATSFVAPLSSPSLSNSLNPCVRVPTCPLVTAQALQAVKLRPVMKRKGLPASIMLADATLAAATLHSQAFAMHADTYLLRKEAEANCSVFCNPNDEDPANTETTLARLGSENSVNHEISMSSGVSSDSKVAKQYAFQADEESYNLTSPLTQRTLDCQTIQPREQHREESDNYTGLLTKHLISSPDRTWIEWLMYNEPNHINTVTQDAYLHRQQVTDNILSDAKLTEPTEKHGNSEKASPYWNLSGTNLPHRHCRETLLESKDEINSKDKIHSEMQNQIAADRPVADSDVRQSDRVFKSDCPRKLHSPEKPIPPKKPDLSAVGLQTTSEANTSPGSCPPKQKTVILHPRPDLPLTSPRNNQPPFASKNTKKVHSSTDSCGTLEITRISHNHNTTGIMGISDSKNTLTGIISTAKNWEMAEGCCTMERSKLSSVGYNSWTCLPSGSTCVTQDRTTNDHGTTSTLENYDLSGTLQILGNVGQYGNTSAQTGGTQYGAAELCTLYKDNPKTFHKRIIGSLAEEEEDEAIESRGRKTSSTKFHKSDKARKRRTRRTGRQLLMMSSTIKPSPSSSTSSSSSSGDEQDVVKGRTVPMSQAMRRPKEVCDEETSTSDSRYSLSSALSTESLCEESSLPDLLIQETGEKEEEQISNEEAQRTAAKATGARGRPGDLFISVSADQMFMSSQTRTTEDLFAVIHRSKRKMLERRRSEETRPCIKPPSCCTFCPVTPADPGPSPTRPAFKTPRSSQTESFKALLLRKGSRANSRPGVSAVERLCKVASCSSNLQSALSATPPPEQTQGNPSNRHGLNASANAQSSSVMAGLHTQLLLFPASMRLRSLAPPCSASSRFAARCRLVAAPMAAIFEGVCEEDSE